MKHIKKLIFLLLLLNSCNTITDNNPADKITDIRLLGIKIDEENYNTLLENKFGNLSVPAQIIYDKLRITGEVEAQGAGSRYFPKWGFTITCTECKTIDGLNKFNLSIQQYDKSKIRTRLTSYLFEQSDFPVFYSAPMFVKLNDENKGIYVLTERIEKEFFIKRNLPIYELIKVAFGAKFTFIQPNHLNDNFEKKIPDDKNYSNLSEFIYALDTVKSSNIFSLNKFLDIELYLKYHAISTIINNTDGLTNNFYLYKENPKAAYKIIPWDFDKTFDPKANFGLFAKNTIIEKLFQSDSCYMIYKSLVKDILNNYFKEEILFPIIDLEYGRIKDVYKLDPYLYPGSSLENEVEVLKKLIIERRKNLLSQVNL